MLQCEEEMIDDAVMIQQINKLTMYSYQTCNLLAIIVCFAINWYSHKRRPDMSGFISTMVLAMNHWMLLT
jgi:hypothetical protein